MQRWLSNGAALRAYRVRDVVTGGRLVVREGRHLG